MIKNILFDFGGVMVAKESWGPVRRLEDKYDFNKWFINKKIESLILDFEKWLLSADMFLFWLRKKIWDELANELYDFWQDRSDVIPFKEMFILVKNLREKGYNCYLVSDTNSIHKNANKLSWFYDVFDEVILSCDIWYSKQEDIRKWTTKIFDYVFEELKIFPNESIFIDDLQENCELANKVGIKTILMKNPKQVISDLSGILGIDL